MYGDPMAAKNDEVGASPPESVSRSMKTKTWRTQVTLAVGLAFCVAAFWFELHRALGGNGLSWAYVFEWPLLAVFAVYMWWKVLHSEDCSTSTARPATIAPEFEGMLAAWEDHRRVVTQSPPDAELQ